ncbi:HNH endonuclease [Candidatus Marinimicrobia bacterium MT.SAG.3]|nr:HNH endonuclease [Candidatus Marinimicrobia bacterium MT.SAG.3]
MSIPKATRDMLLVEAQHRCTVCNEKCFEIHHIIGKADGGDDSPENLIVMCPNCHQHRYHRSGEFTRDQLRQYKKNLQDRNEIEKRLLQNIEDLWKEIKEKSAAEINKSLITKLEDANQLIDKSRSPKIAQSVSQMAIKMAELSIMPNAARRAIEVKYEVERQQLKSSVDQLSVVGIDDDAYRKNNKFGRAYEFVLILDHSPDSDWVKIFDYNYKNSGYSMKRETHIRGDRAVMIIADSDDLQAHTNWVKKLVGETNTWLTTEGYRNIDCLINESLHKELEQFDAIQSMKKRTQSIKI